MNQKFRKMVVVPAACLTILASTPVSTFAASFNDTEIHWAQNAIEIWADHNVIQGYDNMFRPDDTLTRAEMAVIINRIMNYQETAENTFSDLPDDWYTDAVLKLVKQGIMVGYEGQIRPQDRVTREEALVMIARALRISGNGQRAISFTDSDQISEWAASAVSAMMEKGFINGYEDGSFRPQEDMTRACSVTVVNNAIKGFYNEPGTYQSNETIDGIVIVNTPGVILEGMTIKGDLILTPGVKDGKVTLRNTTVSGQQIIMGGSVDNGGSGGIIIPTPTSNPGGGSGGSGGSGGGSVQEAAETDIIVNESYADKSGTVTSGNKRYTIGKNAFDTLEKAIEKAQALSQEASITLYSDLQIENTIELQKDHFTLDGNGHKLTFGQNAKDGIQVIQSQDVRIEDLSIQMQDETGKWNGSYGLQVYESTAVLKDITATGADAGILVNGAEVTLEGVVDVSGNEFGGIEVSKGALATTTPKLMGTVSNLKNHSEASTGKPTIWIDKVSELTSAVVEITGLNEVSKDNDQLYLFIGEVPANAATLEELETALANEEIETIFITSDIEADKTLTVSRPVTIVGQDQLRTIRFEKIDGMEIVNAGTVKFENVKIEVTGQEEGWQGLYALQAYGESAVTLKDVTATGADAGILVNGAEVTLEGVVDVSGNEFGGIEVSKGALATTTPKLKGSVSNLKNDSEASTGKPTIWIDKVSELTSAVVEITGLNEVSKDNDQLYFFIGEDPEATTANAATLEELEKALANDKIETIFVIGDIESDKTLSVSRPVTIVGQDQLRTIRFEKVDGMEIVDAGTVKFENVRIEVTGQEEGWQGLYALQVYGASQVTLKDVTATGADAGILVNGAEVTLDGVVDVSGNEFGGIEVSKGALAATTPKLKGSVSNLKNDSETSTGKPTIWIDKVSELTSAVVEITGLNEVSKDNDQLYFFIGEAPID